MNDETRNIEPLPLDKIVVPEGRRHLQEDKVKDIAAAMHEIGLQNPISVRLAADQYRLIDGLHRLTAAQALGWQEIDCHIVEADDRRARMIEDLSESSPGRIDGAGALRSDRRMGSSCRPRAP